MPRLNLVWSKGLRGFIQGYNAQAVTNEHQVVLAAEVLTIAPDFGHLEPMLDAAQRELAAAGVSEGPGCCWPTPATGISSRWNASSIAASEVLDPAGRQQRKGARPRLGRAATTPHARAWPAITAASFTGNANR